MKDELYFDISSEESGGSLYRVTGTGKISFRYHHSTYDADRDETKLFQTAYESFEAFWKELTKDPEWFYQHPLFVHPEVRGFIQSQLKKVNWEVQGDEKWQRSHQRQWDKVLTDPGSYYKPF